jgi:PadR family transcriptional regulator, regulatory protein AphA
MALQHVILTVLADADATGYEITKEFDTVLGYFWQATHQHVYRELKKMEGAGLVRSRVVPQGGKPDRKVYTLTDAGSKALRAWVDEPLPAAQVNDALMVKVLAAGVTGAAALRVEMAAQRAAHRQRLETYEAIEREHYAPAAVAAMPDNLRLVHLTLRRGIHAERAWLAWLDEVDEVLATLG